jgi:hypothetical protein
VKFSMSEAWRDATAMMSANREVLLIVAGLFFFLPSLILNFTMGDAQGLAMTNADNPGPVLATVYEQWWWLMILMGIVSLTGSLALLALLRDNHRPTVGEAIRAGLIALLPALGAYLIVFIGAMLIFFATFAILGPLLGVDTAQPTPEQLLQIGSIAFLIMIYPAVKLSLSIPVIAVDKVSNPFKILARSWRLTKGNSLRLLLFYALLFIVYIVITIVVGMILAVLSLAASEGVALILNALLSGALSAVVSVVIVAVIAAAHRQLAGPSSQAVATTFE